MVLSDLLNLPDLNKLEMQFVDEVILSDQLHDDPRCGHASKSELIKGFRHMLFTGSGLTRSHLFKRFTTSVKTQQLSMVCAKAKITRLSFSAKLFEELQGLTFLEKVAVDISVYLNCPLLQHILEGLQVCVVA